MTIGCISHHFKSTKKCQSFDSLYFVGQSTNHGLTIDFLVLKISSPLGEQLFPRIEDLFSNQWACTVGLYPNRFCTFFDLKWKIELTKDTLILIVGLHVIGHWQMTRFYSVPHLPMTRFYSIPHLPLTQFYSVWR